MQDNKTSPQRKTMAIPEEDGDYKTMAIPEDPADDRKTMAIPEEGEEERSRAPAKQKNPFGDR